MSLPNIDVDGIVFVIVYEDGKVFITDVRSEAIDFTKHLVNSFIPFKFVIYNTLEDYIVRA